MHTELSINILYTSWRNVISNYINLNKIYNKENEEEMEKERREKIK